MSTELTHLSGHVNLKKSHTDTFDKRVYKEPQFKIFIFISEKHFVGL